jgi:Gpi18-like mannosyltransferase
MAVSTSPALSQSDASTHDDHALRTLVLIWLAWFVLLIGFQALVNWRYQPARPDYAVSWTPGETGADSQEGKIYLVEPFMNQQVSWDSEYYLSIAVGGYDDPEMRLIDVNDRGLRKQISQNYAFFPLYPLVMQAVAVPLRVLGLTPIATATLAGIIVSLLGTLAGMTALYDLTCDQLGRAGGLRTAFYMLIFPTGFFLAQVYTEGLFIGLAFGSLALMRRGHLLPAGVLAALATWARSVGVALVVPLALAWLKSVNWQALRGGERRWQLLVMLGAAALPVIAFVIWQRTLGHSFDLIQSTFFGRELFNWKGMEWGYKQMFDSFRDTRNTQMTVYYALELASVVLAAVACLFTLRLYPGLALFGLASLVVAVTSGAPQSLIRYVLAVPSLFIFLSWLGKNLAFDRAWTILSLLVMVMQVSLFTWDMWVA